jgi:hypothetical protein
MVAAQSRASAASSLLRQLRISRLERIDLFVATIEELSGHVARPRGRTLLAAVVLGLSLLALSGPL